MRKKESGWLGIFCDSLPYCGQASLKPPASDRGDRLHRETVLRHTEF